MKKTIEGNVVYDSSVDYSGVVEITGNLHCIESDIKDSFPKLETIGGDLDCSESDISDSFPKLGAIGGDLDCSGAYLSGSFPMLEAIGWSFYCSKSNIKDSFPKLEAIGRCIYCSEADISGSFPSLEAIGWSFYCSKSNIKDSFPSLGAIGEVLDCSKSNIKDSFPSLGAIGGILDYRKSDIKNSFPMLGAIGWSFYCSEADLSDSFPMLEGTIPDINKAKEDVHQVFLRYGYLLADGILAKLIVTRQTAGGVRVHRVVLVGSTKSSYCVESDGVFSHGDTVKNARESLLYKIGDRDKSDYDGWTLDRKITKQEAIKSYRVITGACEYGVRRFVETHGKLKSKYTVQEVIDITDGQYRNDVYRDFFVRHTGATEDADGL